MSFVLDERLAADTIAVLSLGLCSLRLMNDSRWPWLILVPKRPNIKEMFELTPLDQAVLTFETALVSETLSKMTGCLKLNVAALGNVVPQLHVHVVARNESDANWPRPVWGFGGKTPYEAAEADQLIDRLRGSF